MKFPSSGANASGEWWKPPVRLGPGELEGASGTASDLTWSSEPAGWLWQILPQIEQNNLHSLREPQGLNSVNANAGIMPVEQHVPVAICPSRGERTFTHGFRRIALSDYGSCGGWARGPNRRPIIDNTDFNTTQWHSGVIRPAGTISGPRTTTLAFGRINFGAITDGSSNTALLLEKSANARNYNPVVAAHPAWKHRGVLGGLFAPGYGTNTRSIGPFNPDNAKFVTLPWGASLERAAGDGLLSWRGWPVDENTFGGPHPGTVTGVFCDGSVHSLDMDTDHQTIDDLGQHEDGHVIDHEAF